MHDFKIHSIQHEDPFISNQIKDLSQVFINAPTIAFMPWARCLMPEFIGYTLVDNFYKNMKALFNEIISAHERDYDNESLPRVISSIDKMQTLMRSTALLSGLHRCVPKRDEKRSHSHWKRRLSWHLPWLFWGWRRYSREYIILGFYVHGTSSRWTREVSWWTGQTTWWGHAHTI